MALAFFSQSMAEKKLLGMLMKRFEEFYVDHYLCEFLNGVIVHLDLISAKSFIDIYDYDYRIENLLKI